MRIGDLFQTAVEERIEPVIKVGDTADERKLAAEIGSYVVTPLIEHCIDDILEHYTDTFLAQTGEIGIWIWGYFGSGKSHLAKIIALLTENRKLEGVAACDRFAARVPSDAPRRKAILRSLSRMDQCQTQVLAFNLNTLTDGKGRPLPGLLLSQYYLSLGYSANLIYARVIEAELDRQGRLADLYAAVERRAKKPWADIQRNLSFYRIHLYAAACEVAPEVFPTPADVERALKDAEQGEIYNVEFLVKTILADLARREQATHRTQRILLVLDESGQWIENSTGRLSQLQGLVEEAAVKGQGRIWVIVTTHGDMGSIYKEAHAVDSDMKRIEGRFRFKPGLTTENIELVLEDRLLRKTLDGRDELKALYAGRGGVLRGLGELANTSQALPACTPDSFPTYYPFFPYQVHLIPEIVKSLRSKGGRGEQMSGSTRTLLAITQDILRAGRRRYLDEPVGALVSFDEVYNNLVGEGEISPDVRTELSRIRTAVPGANNLTSQVAEVLYLVRELAYIPRTRDNIARLLVQDTDEDLPVVLARVEPELERLIKAKLVARIGEEYEFLTGERRTFEEEVSTVEGRFRQQDREQGLVKQFIHGDGKAHWREWLGFDRVRYRDHDFPFRLEVDGTPVPGTQGAITLRVTTPLELMMGTALADLENRSLLPDEQYTLFFLSGRVRSFDDDLERYLAMEEVIGNWKGDNRKSEEARKLAHDRETNDLPKLRDQVLDGLRDGLRTGRVVFRGASRALAVVPGQALGDVLRGELAAFWPVLYPKFDRVPVRITNDQKAIADVLAGVAALSSEVRDLKLYDKSGKVDPHSPLLDAIRITLATQQNAGRRTLGQDLLATLTAPPYGWDPNAVRVGVAALVRSAVVKVLINKKAYTNPADRELVDALRVSRSFDKVELVLEETDVAPEILTETRAFLIRLAKRRNIDETPAALSDVAGELAAAILAKAGDVELWAAGSGMPLPAEFSDGVEAWRQVTALASPIHRVREVHTHRETLEAGHQAIEAHAAFQAQQGIPFIQLRQLRDRLEAIEHRTDLGGAIRLLLSGYRAAEKAVNFADREVWRQLQSHRAQAELELTPLLDSWRAEARRRLDEALERLPSDLAQLGLAAGLAASLAQPLTDLRAEIEGFAVPAQVAALPERVDDAIRRMGTRITQALPDKTPPPEPVVQVGEVTAKRKRCQVRTAGVAAVTLVHNVGEWDALKGKLDEHVRNLLDQGYDVELI